MKWQPNVWLASLPSTNYRIFNTMNFALITTLRYVGSGASFGKMKLDNWEPSEAWLVFLAAMAGLDIAQFFAKRATHQPTPPQGADVEDAAANPPQG